MTDTVVLALIAGLPPTLTALAAALITLRTGQKVVAQTTAAAVQADTASAKIDTLADGQHEIHGLVNSNLVRVKAELAAARAEIDTLRDVVQTLTQRLGPRALSPTELAAVTTTPTVMP